MNPKIEQQIKTYSAYCLDCPFVVDANNDKTGTNKAMVDHIHRIVGVITTEEVLSMGE